MPLVGYSSLDMMIDMGEDCGTESSGQPVAHSQGDNMLVSAESTDIVANANPSRDDIVRLQSAMIPFETEQPEPKHYFAPGMYLRELTVPAGMLIVGKIHKHEHFLLVLKGQAIVISEFGRMAVSAGHISVSPAGVKRIVLALEDTQFVTIHVNKEDSQDLSVIEAEHIEPESLSAIGKNNQEVLQ